MWKLRRALSKILRNHSIDYLLGWCRVIYKFIHICPNSQKVFKAQSLKVSFSGNGSNRKYDLSNC